jgi:ABC-type uncharacterized transport system ATPase subunit
VQVRAGEVVGIAGVSGNGQRELLYALSGEDTRAQPGHGPGRRPERGAGMPPSRRRALGLHFRARGAPGPRRGAQHGPGAQPLLTRTRPGPGGWIRTGALQAQAQAIIQRFGVKAGGPHAAAQVAVGRQPAEVHRGTRDRRQPRLLIVSQPTWGVDVGAAAQIRGEMLALRDAGCAVLVVSEELDELFELCDRLHVIAKGHLSPSVAAPTPRWSALANG